MNASEFAYWYRRGYGPIFGCSLPQGDRRQSTSFGLDDHLDALDDDLGDLEDEVSELFGGDDELFGIIPALIIGAASAAPAIAMAVKGKKKRLESLEKKLGKLKAKAEGASGKKADRLEKKIGKIEARIEKLKSKLGVDDEADDDKDEDDEEFGILGIRRRHHRRERRRDRRQERRGTSYGLGPGLGSTYRFVPAALEDDPLEDVDGELFGSLPVELLGTHQLTSSDAATVDEGTIIAVPVIPDHPLHPHTNAAVRAGVSEFLSEYGQQHRGGALRRR